MGRFGRLLCDTERRKRWLSSGSIELQFDMWCVGLCTRATYRTVMLTSVNVIPSSASDWTFARIRRWSHLLDARLRTDQWRDDRPVDHVGSSIQCIGSVDSDPLVSRRCCTPRARMLPT